MIKVFSNSTFIQSLGTERITNNLFDTWSGDNLSSWTTFETAPNPEITQRASGQLHQIVSGGLGAANFYSTATVNRPITQQTITVSVGDWLEVFAICSAGEFTDDNVFDTSALGRIDIDNTANPTFIKFTKTGSQYGLEQATTAGIRYLGVTPPINATFDSISVKKLTLNSVSNVAANGTFRIEFTKPVTLFGGQKIRLNYRIQDASNYYSAIIFRDRDNQAWYLYITKTIAGVVSTPIEFLNNPVQLPSNFNVLQVTVQDDLHTLYVKESGFYVKHGFFVDDDLDTATGTQVIYNTGFTPIEHSVLVGC